jgi:hypothetical protein
MARLLAVLILLVLAVSAAPASAKLYFTSMGGRAVRWDQWVDATIANCPANPSCESANNGTRIFIRRAGAKRSRFVARVEEGRLSFRVPHVLAGRYVLVGKGRTISRSFRIRAR